MAGRAVHESPGLGGLQSGVHREIGNGLAPFYGLWFFRWSTRSHTTAFPTGSSSRNARRVSRFSIRMGDAKGPTGSRAKGLAAGRGGADPPRDLAGRSRGIRGLVDRAADDHGICAGADRLARFAPLCTDPGPED